LSVNRGKPYLLIIPEDDDDRAFAEGARGALPAMNVKIVANSNGWPKIEKLLAGVYNKRLRANANEHLLILIDFDTKGQKRYDKVFGWVPEDVKDRVFIIGPEKEPKDLKKSLKLKMSFWQMGDQLVSDCDEQQINPLWDHDMLSHNKPEFRRLLDTIGLKLLNS